MTTKSRKSKKSPRQSIKSSKEIVNEIVEADFSDIPEEIPPFKSKGKNRGKNGQDVLIMHWNGRFGNRMHTYAYAHERAKMFNGTLYLPSEWEGDQLFNLNHKVIYDDELRLHINQSTKPFDEIDYRMTKINEFSSRSDFDFKYANADNPNENYTDFGQDVCIDSVSAYHTSIFEKMKISDVHSLYEFKDEVKNLDVYKRLEDKQGTYDIAHLRRDDISDVNYKDNGGYSVVAESSYLKAFEKYGYDSKEIEWTTDDRTGNWIKEKHQYKRGGWHYPVGSEVVPDIIFDWLPDFLRLYFARSIFRANSSFSWWACNLAKGRETPPKIFAPRLDKRVLYAREETFKQEADFDFEEGNHPHWLCVTGEDQCTDIVFSDE
ncbi:MAG: hypothetical protein ACJAT2_003833 [Bacteriovoracaceae bacterium]|jgi:hypothetical protein